MFNLRMCGGVFVTGLVLLAVSQITMLRSKEHTIAAAYQSENETAFIQLLNFEVDRSLVDTQRTLAFAQARNAEIEASIAAYASRSAERFAEVRNAEIDSSLVAYNTQRTLAFAQARNAEIEASIAAYASRSAERFAEVRNAEIDSSLVAYNTQRTLVFAQTRNAEIAASIAAYASRSAERFAAARNAEIHSSLVAYNTQRTLAFAQAASSKVRSDKSKGTNVDETANSDNAASPQERQRQEDGKGCERRQGRKHKQVW